jgi:hypothetical protein
MRSEGDQLTAVDLHMLMVQLHILELETANLQTVKKILDGDSAR